MTMDLPRVAETCPKKIELEPGKKYAWCSCGLSENQPFCDGKHQGSGFAPIVFQATESKEAYFCQCKKTGNGPYCDGSHNTIGQTDS